MTTEKTARSEALVKIFKTTKWFADTRILGVEVGVRHGENVRYLLKAMPNLCIVGIDFYEPYTGVNEDLTREKQAVCRVNAQKVQQDFPTRFALRIDTSIDAAELTMNYSYEFVFIDAMHTYDAVKNDLLSWYKKVLPGGILCGHDYDMTPVKQAVNRFFKFTGQEIHHEPFPADVWWVEM